MLNTANGALNSIYSHKGEGSSSTSGDTAVIRPEGSTDRKYPDRWEILDTDMPGSYLVLTSKWQPIVKQRYVKVYITLPRRQRNTFAIKLSNRIIYTRHKNCRSDELGIFSLTVRSNELRYTWFEMYTYCYCLVEVSFKILRWYETT